MRRERRLWAAWHVPKEGSSPPGREGYNAVLCPTYLPRLIKVGDDTPRHGADLPCACRGATLAPAQWLWVAREKYGATEETRRAYALALSGRPWPGEWAPGVEPFLDPPPGRRIKVTP